MADRIPLDPISPADVLPYLREIRAGGVSEQAAMRKLDAFWTKAINEGRAPKSGSAWEYLEALIADFHHYEPNPQFCNRDAGMYDNVELERRVDVAIAKFTEQGS